MQILSKHRLQAGYAVVPSNVTYWIRENFVKAVKHSSLFPANVQFSHEITNKDESKKPILSASASYTLSNPLPFIREAQEGSPVRFTDGLMSYVLNVEFSVDEKNLDKVTFGISAFLFSGKEKRGSTLGVGNAVWDVEADGQYADKDVVNAFDSLGKAVADNLYSVVETFLDLNRKDYPYVTVKSIKKVPSRVPRAARVKAAEGAKENAWNIHGFYNRGWVVEAVGIKHVFKSRQGE